MPVITHHVITLPKCTRNVKIVEGLFSEISREDLSDLNKFTTLMHFKVKPLEPTLLNI